MGNVIYAVCSEIASEHETKRSMSCHVTWRDARKHLIKLMDDYINHLLDDATVNDQDVDPSFHVLSRDVEKARRLSMFSEVKFSVRNAEFWLKRQDK